MTFEEAIKKMVQKYYDDDYEEDKEIGPKLYTKKYFDGMRDEYLTQEEVTKDKKKNGRTK